MTFSSPKLTSLTAHHSFFFTV